MKYGVILADPPWKYPRVQKGRGRIKDHYPLMETDEICRLPVGEIAADSAVLLVWATWPQLGGALRVIEAWGFEYRTGFPWVKLYDPPAVDVFGNLIARPVYGTGFWVRGASEPLLVAWRGGNKPPSAHFMGLLSERLEHSRKPDNIYHYAESFPGPYLELFARRQRPGWDVFGNEVEGSITLPQGA